MIYFPETINTVSTLNTILPSHSLVSSWLCTPLTLCMLASWSRGGVVFLDLLPSSHSITSCPFPYLGSTDAPCSRLGASVPPSPRWCPNSQGPRTLPYRDPEQTFMYIFAYNCTHWMFLENQCLEMSKTQDFVWILIKNNNFLELPYLEGLLWIERWVHLLLIIQCFSTSGDWKKDREREK